ncbi:uncharacterized protein LOC144994020 isoform X2 [Oryzias latipes]
MKGTLVCFLLLRVLCLLHPGTAEESVLDTIEGYDYDYDYTIDSELHPIEILPNEVYDISDSDLQEILPYEQYDFSGSEPNPTEILPTKQPDFSGVWWRIIYVPVGLAALSVITASVCIWTRTQGAE